MINTQLLQKKLRTAAFAVALLLGTSAVFAQVKIGTNPTVIDPANNLEVESSTAGNKVSVNKTTGKITIADGSQANDNILTSDANGVATWKPKGSIRVEETVFIGEQQGTYLITTWNGTFNALKDRIPLTPRAGSLPGYDATTKMYTIQESGYYRVATGAFGVGTIPSIAGTIWWVYLHPFNVYDNQVDVTANSGPVKSVFWQAYLTAGTEISLYTTSTGTNQNVNVSKGFLSITKMF
jgi:hypothetical protein